jgi:hypothetical protein
MNAATEHTTQDKPQDAGPLYGNVCKPACERPWGRSIRSSIRKVRLFVTQVHLRVAVRPADATSQQADTREGKTRTCGEHQEV